MAAARLKAERESEIRRIRDEQIRQRQENAARAVERDRQHWEEVQKLWHEANETDKKQQDFKTKVSKRYYVKII